MDIITAANDSNLFKPYLQGQSRDLRSWRPWMTALRCLYGLKLRKSEYPLVEKCTHRNPDKLPKDGFRSALFLCGRRSGKSKVSGLIAAYESLLSGREKTLSPGEIGVTSVVAPTRDQSEIIRSYCRSALQGKVLSGEVVDDLKQSLTLSNGVQLRSLTGSFKSTRGYSQICTVVDEVCYFNVTTDDSDHSIKSDTELIRSIRPSLLTSKGHLLCVSTKYRPAGWAYKVWRDSFGNDESRTMVWDSDSKTMNPTLDQRDIDQAMREDPAAARAEFLNQWREDVESYLPDSVVRACVVVGRIELLPKRDVRYFGFCDVSGGRQDSATLAVGHRDGRKVIIDKLVEYKPPFSPYEIAKRMAEVLRKYGLSRVTGDRYAAEYTSRAFANNGISYKSSEKNKSEMYLELIGPVCSREIELLDNERLVSQLAGLERKTRSGGRDICDHGPGGHDDLANACAGCASVSCKSEPFVGVLGAF